ncbi:hypothetical protein CLU79DRAFT_733550 [Phycomyces nitens]|nr:hypothetical protein CLU79DRAFT_733550 [Phycomyces nitens]
MFKKAPNVIVSIKNCLNSAVNIDNKQKKLNHVFMLMIKEGVIVTPSTSKQKIREFEAILFLLQRSLLYLCTQNHGISG